MRHLRTEDAPKSTVPFSQHYTHPYWKPVKTQTIEVLKGHDKFGQHLGLAVTADQTRVGYGIKIVENADMQLSPSQTIPTFQCNISKYY